MTHIATSLIRVRFAPSPTGHLHIGGLRTIIFNWLFAKHNNGTFLIRIEDTDLERSKPEYTQSILDSFAWMDIHADEPIVIQSSRVPEHRRVAQELIKQGKAYYCFCTQEAVIERHKQKKGSDDAFIKYDGFCKKNIVSAQALQKPHVIRFALPFEQGEISWQDLIHGQVTFNADQLDDFIIIRSDGMSMYNFAVVVDDAFMNITHVIRGDDHISNTPKQILLYQACGLPLPYFGHLSMILGPSGDRLSKRDGAVSVLEYKTMGYLPDALLNYLVRLGWSHGDQEVFTRQELIELFSLEAVNKKAAVFDPQKLDWLNGTYIRTMTNDAILQRIEKDVFPEFRSQLKTWNEATLLSIIGLYKERVKTLRELGEELFVLYGPTVTYHHADVKQWIVQDTPTHLQKVIEGLRSLDVFTVESVSNTLKELAKELGIKFVALAQPIRIALVGKSASPGVFELLVLLGKQTSIERIEALLEPQKRL